MLIGNLYKLIQSLSFLRLLQLVLPRQQVHGNELLFKGNLFLYFSYVGTVMELQRVDSHNDKSLQHQILVCQAN
jgi:hypothetical protein